MDLTTVAQVLQPASRDDLPSWRAGDAWLAGGTWLFSEPQTGLSRLINLDGLGWAPLTASPAGLEIAATCRIADLYAFEPPRDWTAAALFRPCCDALLASFKIWNQATVGGNLCLSLPAGTMVALTAALDGICTLWQPGGGERRVPVIEFVTGNRRNLLQPGELLRAVILPAAALQRRAVLRHVSRGPLGRVNALVIGTLAPAEDRSAITIAAATTRPVRLDLPRLPSAAELRAALDEMVPQSLYFDDADTTADYRRHIAYHLAEDVRLALLAEAR